MATRTSYIELHAPAGLLDCPLTFTLRAHARLLDISIAVAVCANILACDVQAHDTATDRCPERHVDLVFEIGPRFGAFLRRRTTAPATTKDAREDIAKSSATARASLAARAFEHI